MKYKLKDSYKGIYNRQFEKGEIIDSNDEFTGIVIEVPFSDTRFFERVKTRKFVVEVDDSNINHFTYLNRNMNWVVTEITESEYLVKLKANPNVSNEVIEIMSDYENLVATHTMFLTSFNEHGKNYKLSVVKDMKYFLDERFPSIAGLKNAKDIVDSWW